MYNDLELFKGLSKEQINTLFQMKICKLKKYYQHDIIFNIGENVSNMFVLIEGSISIQKYGTSSNRMIITTLDNRYDVFGEIYLFLKKELYDVEAYCVSSADVLVISKDILSLNNDISDQFINNLLMIFAYKAYSLSNRIKVLSKATLREKIVTYLNNYLSDNKIILKDNREVIADYLNVARPSLSRELKKMETEGIIKVEHKIISIVDLNLFNSYL